MPHPHAPPAARRAAPLIILAMLLAGVALAEAPAAESPAQPARAAGLTFLIAHDFQLSGFDGALLSWRTRSEDGRGWRFGIRLSGWLGRADSRADRPDTFHTQSIDSRQAGVNLTALRVHERTRGRALGYYWAVGPTAGYTLSRSDYEFSSGNPEYVRENAWRAGVTGVVGVEWRANDGLSLLGEYGVALEYAWTRHQVAYGDWSDSQETQRNVELNAREARLGLTAWFR